MARSLLSTFLLVALLAPLLDAAVAAAGARRLATDPKPSPSSVIIVGAGMAGVMAAKTLSEAGVKDFVILEATEVIGGRMREADFAGKRIELGANWVEGVNKTTTNPIWKLANQYKLRTFYSNFDNLSHNIYTQNGHLQNKLGENFMSKSDDSSDFVDELGLSKSESNAPDMSVLSAQKLHGVFPKTPVEMVLDYYNYDYEFAEPPSVTSLKNTQPNPTFHNFGDDNYLVADQRGYSYLVQKLAEEFLANKNGKITDPRLQLNKVVRQIKYSKTGVAATTEDGKVYNSKYIIVTVSLGVLQSDLIKFNPGLPDWKREALSEFDMAVYTKIFLKFPYKFWPSNGPLTEFFLYADERRGYYPIWQHLENEYPGANVMFVTVTDYESRRIEQQPNNETIAEIHEVLKSMFGPSVPKPTDILVPRWWSNRFFVGSFSNWPIGVEAFEFERIQAPLSHTLYFAGEHTHEHYNGYVHGAYYSGIDAANKLLDCMKKNKCVDKVPKAPAHRTGEKRRRNMESAEASVVKERDLSRREWDKQLHGILAVNSAH
ncbi:polyamine oxidase [Selaginella moellendorffii]|uniref:polyamine oxidase n=1 Tax=Selaginella moellendorffii TaxID=88036 RepID=UPI000D1C5304|nr:polyamine oxidase [Selaginella moellendorffii]|eukprot:XP_002986594.2 polyamine oxidase [Selaginella moellendorffii]